MIIGYNLGGDFNGNHMFDLDDPNLPICKKCGYVTNLDYISPLFKLKKQIYDISYTYDGRVIVSLKFKEFCLRHNYKGLEFRNLPNDPFFFVFVINNIVNYDTERKVLRFDKFCDECKRYKSITPGFPIFLKDAFKPLEDKFFATDVHFASGNEKSPLLIVGVDAYIKIKKEKFRGIYLFKIEQ